MSGYRGRFRGFNDGWLGGADGLDLRIQGELLDRSLSPTDRLQVALSRSQGGEMPYSAFSPLASERQLPLRRSLLSESFADVPDHSPMPTRRSVVIDSPASQLALPPAGGTSRDAMRQALIDEASRRATERSLLRGESVLSEPADSWQGNATRRDLSQVGGAPIRMGAGGEVTTVPDLGNPIGQQIVAASPALQTVVDTAVTIGGGPTAIPAVKAANGGSLAPEPLAVNVATSPAAAAIADPWEGSATVPPRPRGADIDLGDVPGGTSVDYGDRGVSTEPRPRGRRRGRNAPKGPSTAPNTGRRGLVAGLQDAVELYTAPADFGLGRATENWIKGNAAKVANPAARQALGNLGGLAGGAIRLAPWIAAAAPVVTSAASGMENGPGGAAVSGGITAAGALLGGTAGFFLGGPPGAAIGAGIGGSIAAPMGDAARQSVAGMVDAGKGGDTGIGGQIGRAIDPFFTSETERAQLAQMAQLNSPAAIALKQEQERRNSQARADQLQALYLQTLMRG